MANVDPAHIEFYTSDYPFNAKKIIYKGNIYTISLNCLKYNIIKQIKKN